MAVSYCGRCGEADRSEDFFCTSCGHRLRAVQAGRDGATAAGTDDLVALRHAVDLLGRGEPAVALTVLERLCAEQPGWAAAKAYLGLALLRLTRVGDARVALEEAVRAAPESFICRSKYAEFLAQLGFYDQAVRELETALRIGAPNADSQRAARELLAFSREKAKGLYYRHTASPARIRLKNLLPRRLAPRGAPVPMERGNS
jgi:tetratricopeptide (TPR) repeat protein